MDQNATIATNTATNLLIAMALEVEKKVRVHISGIRRVQKGRKQEDLTRSTNVTSQSEMMKEGGTMFAFLIIPLYCCQAQNPC